MPDQFGALEFPAQYPQNGESITDPRLDKIASFLQAVLNAELSAAWGAVNPNKRFVETISTNDPTDSTFNQRDLPALFVFDPRSVTIQTADDLLEDVSSVTVLWIPQNTDQFKRSLRSTGINGFKKTVERALYLGVHPAWIDPGDPDPQSLTYGSSLITRAGLARWPSVSSAQVTPLTIITDGAAPMHYGGFSLTLEISEMTSWSKELAGSSQQAPSTNAPSKVDIKSTSGALELESIIPTT